MAIIIPAQVTSSSLPALSASVPALLAAVPPGPCEVVISNVSGVTVYIGLKAAMTLAQGFPVPTGAPPVTLRAYKGSAGCSLYVLAGAGSITAGVGVIISTDG